MEHICYIDIIYLHRQILIDGVKSYLERLYQNYMISICNTQPQLAQRSGIPGTIHTVRGYINCIRHTLPDTMEVRMGMLYVMIYVATCMTCMQSHLISPPLCVLNTDAGISNNVVSDIMYIRMMFVW